MIITYDIIVLFKKNISFSDNRINNKFIAI